MPPGANGQLIIVVGGGISGLSAAYFLRKRGLPVVLIEQEPRLGGLLETIDLGGNLIEGGPDSFLAAKPAALELIRELGLSADVIDSNDRQRVTYIARKGRLVPMPDGLVMMAPTKFGPLLKSPLLSWKAKFTAAREFFRKPSGPRPDRSVAEFVRDHFGEEAVQYLAEPLLTGVFGGDVEKLSAKLVLARFVALEEKYGSVTRGLIAERTPGNGSLFKSLKGGMEYLTATLRARLQDVRFVSGTAEILGEGPKVRVDGEWIEAAAVVLAVRAWQAAPLVANLDPELARLLAGIDYSSAVTMGLTYRMDRFPHPLDGFGFLVPAVERRNINACTWVTRKFDYRTAPDHVVLRAFLGGDRWCEAPDEDIYDAVREDLLALMDVDQMPERFVIRRWPRSMPQYYVGHAATIAAIERQIDPRNGVYLAGNYFDGVGIPDCIRRSKEIAQRI